jgi:16S rRNA (guanine527-N7)-methyltransferase
LSLTPELLGESLEKAGLLPFFRPDSLRSLAQFTNRMLELNQTLNLTKWIGEEEILTNHILDSAKVLPYLKPLIVEPQRWLDLGSGCGFPGAVLIAAFPQVEVTLLDSVGKKTKALVDCLQAAGWKAKTMTGRAEEIGRAPQTRERWDGVTARAVADFPVVLEYALPLLKTGGYLVNWMTAHQLRAVDKSKAALEALHGKILQKAEYLLPRFRQSRYFVVVEKTGKTPATYPRPIGQPSKRPL